MPVLSEVHPEHVEGSKEYVHHTVILREQSDRRISPGQERFLAEFTLIFEGLGMTGKVAVGEKGRDEVHGLLRQSASERDGERCSLPH